MATPIDLCPECGEQDLVAICNTIVEYDIVNDGDEGQDWEKSEVDDDSSDVISIKCESCGEEWFDGEFTLDRNGFLVELAPKTEE